MNMRTLAVMLLIALSAEAQAQTEIAVDMPAAVQTPAPAPPADTKQLELLRASTFAEKYFAIDDYASALEQYRRADALLPNHPAILFNTSLILSRMGRFAEAQEKIDQYLKLYPAGQEIDQVQKLRIDLDFERELQQKAQETQSYVELFNRARFLYDKGDLAGSLKLFEEAAQQRPDDAAVAFNQSVAYEALGDYPQATERLRKFQALAPGADKAMADDRIFALETEITDRKENHVCPFCGKKLSKSSLWCPRCWRGPYDPTAARFNTRPCGTGASATRTILYGNDRVHQNEDLSCNFTGDRQELFRFSTARQRLIQNTRIDEGWRYRDDALISYQSRDANVLRLVQGSSLEKLINLSTGDVLNFSGRQLDGRWILDREQVVIDGQKFNKSYNYDEYGRITSEVVRYQNGMGCGHLIQTTATYVYGDARLESVNLVSTYTGFELEGAPQVEWKGTMRFSHDGQGRVTKEEFTLDSYTKTWTKKPFGPLRNQLEGTYTSMRVKKPLDIMKTGDICTSAGPRLVGNQVDLRPFYTIAPDLAVALPLRTSKVVVTLTYPPDFKLAEGGR